LSDEQAIPETEAAATFEQALSELEGIVRRLDGPDLELDEALALFEKGIRRLREAGRMLDAGRGRVEELIENAAGDLRAIGLEAGSEADAENGD